MVRPIWRRAWSAYNWHLPIDVTAGKQNLHRYLIYLYLFLDSNVSEREGTCGNENLEYTFYTGTARNVRPEHELQYIERSDLPMFVLLKYRRNLRSELITIWLTLNNILNSFVSGFNHWQLNNLNTSRWPVWMYVVSGNTRSYYIPINIR